MVIQHFSHHHPLSYKEAEKTSILDGSSRNCYGCSGGLVSSSNNADDEAYCCLESECNFFLHKKCAELPQKLQSFFHIAHPLTLLAKAPSIDGGFICGVCEESRSGFTYHCSECQFNIDPECSFKKPNWLNDLGQREIEHFSHQHHLVPYMVREEAQAKCDGCILPVSGLAYVCSRCCHFHLHTTCIDLEKKKTRHPFHPAHVLNLLAKSPDKDTKCDACFKLIEGFVYRCDRGDRGNRSDFCGFNLDAMCASKVSIMKQEIHWHPLGSFKEIYDVRSCKVCGQSCREDIYRCVQCDFNFHKSCAATPICIYHDCHSHVLELVVPEKNDENADDEDEYCDVCNEKRNVNCAAYICTGCNFVAHIDCVKDQARIVDTDSTSSDEVDAREPETETTSGDGNAGEEIQGETVKQQVESMLELLKDLFSKQNQLKKEVKSSVEQAERIILVGEAGVGKTWMARQISELAIRKEIVDAVLWIYLYKKYDDKSLLQDIACQLSLVCTGDELEDDDNDSEEVEEVEEEEELEWEKKKEEQEQEKILKQKIRSGLGKKCLLVLDGEKRDERNEKEVMMKLTALIYPNEETSFKVLITRRSRGGSEETGEVVKVLKPLNKEDAFSLLEERGQKAKLMTLSVSEQDVIINKSNGHPAAIIVIAEALRHMAVGAKTVIDGVTDLSRFGFDMLPNNVMKNCNWYSKQLFRRFGAVHQNELISFWIMEGYLGSADCIKTAYAKGHDVLVTLVDRGMLKMLEDDVVTMEEGALTVTDDPNYEIGWTASLGLPDVLVKDEWDGLGRVALSVSGGMIRTHCSHKNWQMVSTLLIDGNHLDKSLFSHMTGLQVLAIFKPRFRSLPSSSLCKIKKLRVLVLRGCDLLDDVRDISKLRTLVVLEISGAPFLEQIPDDLFDKMPGLRSLNLSQVPISSLPSPPQKSHELCWLILRGCSKLKTLPRLTRFTKLELLDLSDATSLENVDLNGLYRLNRLFLRGCSNLKNSRLRNLKNLEILDHSAATSLENVELHLLSSLRQLFLRGCSKLKTLTKWIHFTKLELLDLSDATSLENVDLSGLYSLHPLFPGGRFNLKNSRLGNFKNPEMLDHSAATSLENVELYGLSSLRQLFLRGCTNLKELPQVRNFKFLEVLDLTDMKSLEVFNLPDFIHQENLQVPCNIKQLILKGCSGLKELPSLEWMTKLEVLDLTGATSLEKVELHKLCSLHRLILKACSSLTELPSIEQLTNLEVLDLAGATSLKRITDQTFSSLQKLQVIDFSATKVEKLPDIHDLEKLDQLILRGCPSLEILPHLPLNIHSLHASDCTKLKELGDNSLYSKVGLHIDLSRSAVEYLPSSHSDDISQISKLILSGCSGLKELPHTTALIHLEVLDLSDAKNLCKFEDKSFEHLKGLQVLNVSNTKVESLPNLSKLENLRELKLSGCGSLVQLPQMDGLKKLEVLNLSGCSCLRGIGFRPFECMTSLKILNLSETKIKVFPSWISQFIGLESVGLPDLKDIERQVSEPSPEEVKFNHNGTFSLKSNSTERITKIHFPAGSLSGKGKQIIGSYQDGLNSIICSLQPFDFAIEAFLETRGFRSFPEESKSAVEGTKFFSFIGSIIRCLSDLDAVTLTEMKHCWLERCLNMENILHGEKEKAELVGNLESLWASNLPSLRSMYGNDMEINCFKNLKYLFLDCCPKLTKIFSSSQLPQNLETLEVKFCDNLKTLFESEESSDCRLEKLQKLHLFELPELKSIGAVFPNLKSENEKIKHCPNLQYN